MTRKMCMICDICGELIADETNGYVMNIGRAEPVLNTVASTESYDVCPACKDTLESWIKGRKGPVTNVGEIPVINGVI